MPIQPPTSDIETRLLVVAQMLEHAVAEVQHVMNEIRHGPAAGAVAPEKQRDPGGPT